MLGGDDSLSASPDSHLGVLVHIALARHMHRASLESSASAGSAPPSPERSIQPSEFRVAVEALRTFLDSAGYPLRANQLMEIIIGDAVPERPVEFIELVGEYVQLAAEEHLAFLVQVAYDLLRHYLGPEFYAAVVHPSTERDDGASTDGVRRTTM